MTVPDQLQVHAVLGVGDLAVAPTFDFLDAQLHKLGPTATATWLYLVHHAGSTVDTTVLAAWLGIRHQRSASGNRAGRSVEATLERLTRRRVVRIDGDDAWVDVTCRAAREVVNA